MPNISTRGSKLPESPIRKLVPYAEKAQKKGIKIYYLNIGQPDIETPPEFLEAITNSNTKIVAYTHSAGNESYRKKLVDYYRKFDINNITYEDIIVTVGASEAISFAYLACLNPGDEVIIPEPFYANYQGFAVTSGIKIRPITTQIKDNFDLPDIDKFEKVITEKTKAIMICNPSNPTGKLYSKEDLDKLEKLVKKHDLYLFVDEVYKEFVYDGEEFHSILKYYSIKENVVVFDSISKKYSACGARIGSLISRNKEVIATATKIAQARLSPPMIDQIGAEALVGIDESYIKETINEYKDRRDFLVQGLRKIEGVVVPEVHGAFYLTVKLPVEDTEDFCKWMLSDFSYEGSTVMMAPASGFYATTGLGKQEVRIAYVLNKEDLQKAAKCIEEGIKVYKKKVS